MSIDDQREDLGQLFNLTGKSQVEAYCRELIITSEAFTDILLAGQVTGLGPYSYANHFADLEPESVRATPEQLDAFGRHGVGRLSGKALTAARKTNELFKVRRMVAVHLFYTTSHKFWHLFYFDQRDLKARNNHWKYGPHIHYCRDTFTREPLNEVWRKVHLPKPEFPKSVHVRYDHHHNRPQA